MICWTLNSLNDVLLFCLFQHSKQLVQLWIVVVAGLVAKKRRTVVYIPGAENLDYFLAEKLFVIRVNVDFSEGDCVDSI